MAGIYESDQVLKKQQLGNTIFVAQSMKTPFTRLLKRGEVPVNMLNEWPVQAYPAQKITGTVDGTDIASFESSNRVAVRGYGMWMMSDGWMASKLANLTETAGVKAKQEAARQKRDDSLQLGQKIERQLLSNLDTVAESKPGTAYRNRGAFSWLSAAAQATLPVDASFRPDSACRFTDPLDHLTADAFETMLEAAADAKKEAVNLTGIVGMKLKRAMSLWAQKVTVATGEAAIQQYNLTAKEKALSQVVDFFEFDAGKVSTIPSFYLACAEATGLATNYTSRSGIFVDLSMWDICWMQEPQSYDEPPKSGGPRGYSDAVFILRCLNPLGQMSVLTDAST